ncbi:actin-bundling T4SS effector WalE1 family protein [Wolbachia endosymbiont of Tettigetta isshikii]|uniref:actin-bundling T4SS effector WalE1 family protein n=1 Tax=Wolbachia endosymbiont of Tettigetta isshikii TaxID=3239093 RepID=UPI0039800B22
MLNSETNSNRRQSSTFMETLQDKLKDIKNFSKWSAKEQMVAVTAVGVIFGALLPVVAVALPVAATGAAVALTLFFAVKAVEYGYKGLKWSAEKTLEGSEYTAGKIKAGAVYAKDSVKEAASSLKQAAREGTSSALKKMGEGVQNLGRKMSDAGTSISDFKRIPYSAEPQEPRGVVLLAKRELDPDLIDSNRDLERDSLQSNSLPRSSLMSSLDSISTDGSTEGLLNPEEHKEVKAPTLAKDKALSWFIGNEVLKGAGEATRVKYQVLSKPDATQSAETGNSIVDQQEPLRSNSPSHVGTGDSPIDLPKAPESPTTSGYGSGRSSHNSSDPSTTTKGQKLFMEELQNELEQRFAKLRASPNKLPEQQLPSTKMDVETDVQRQTRQEAVR